MNLFFNFSRHGISDLYRFEYFHSNDFYTRNASTKSEQHNSYYLNCKASMLFLQHNFLLLHLFMIAKLFQKDEQCLINSKKETNKKKNFIDIFNILPFFSPSSQIKKACFDYISKRRQKILTIIRLRSVDDDANNKTTSLTSPSQKQLRRRRKKLTPIVKQ